MKSYLLFLAGFLSVSIIIFFSFRESDSADDVRPFVRRDNELGNICNNLDDGNRKLLQLVLFKEKNDPVAIDPSIVEPAVKISQMRIDLISFLRIQRCELIGNVEGITSYTADTLRMNLVQNPFDKDKTGKFLFGNGPADSLSCLAHQVKIKLSEFDKEANLIIQAQYGYSDQIRLPGDSYDFASHKFIPWEQYRFKNCFLVEAAVALKETEADCLVAENRALTALLKQKYASHK